jgi:predicted aspartyl protease
MVSIERGSYSELGEPLLVLNLHIREEEYLPLEVVVDTGFNRSMLVFEDDAARANLPPSRNVTSKAYLADGSDCPTVATFGYLKWLGRLEQVEILVVAKTRSRRDRCLIGMELLRGTDILLREDGFDVQSLPPP